MEGFEDPPTAPKIDKGKGKAESEPKEPENEGSVLVIRRMRMRMGYEDALEVAGASPTDR